MHHLLQSTHIPPVEKPPNDASAAKDMDTNGDSQPNTMLLQINQSQDTIIALRISRILKDGDNLLEEFNNCAPKQILGKFHDEGSGK